MASTAQRQQAARNARKAAQIITPFGDAVMKLAATLVVQCDKMTGIFVTKHPKDTFDARVAPLLKTMLVLMKRPDINLYRSKDSSILVMVKQRDIDSGNVLVTDFDVNEGSVLLKNDNGVAIVFKA